MSVSSLHAATGHDHGVAVGEVITTEDLAFGSPAFAEGGAPKLTAKDDEGVFK